MRLSRRSIKDASSEMANKSSQLDQAKELFVTYSNNTTLHGFRNVTDKQKHYCLRIKWVLFLCVMITLLIVILVHMKLEHDTYPTITKIHRELAAGIVFPAVTICNLSPYSSKYVGASDELKNYLLTLWGKGWMAQPINWTDPEYEGIADTNVTEWHDMASHRTGTEEFIYLCTFNWALGDCTEMFEASETDLGRCFTFNKHKKTIQKMVGFASGLDLWINIDQFRPMPSPYHSAGIVVAVHHPDDNPAKVGVIGKFVEPGTETFIGVEPMKYKNLPKPFKVGGDYCIDIENGEEPPIFDSIDYDQQACIRECVYSSVHEKCGCCRPGTEGTWGVRGCTAREYLECFNPALWASLTNNVENDFANCSHCRLRCTRTEYNLQISSGRFPSEYYNSLLSKMFNLPPDAWGKNFIQLHVHFNSLTETIVEYEPVYTWSNICVQLGGYMGVFIGASLMSIWEFVEFITTLVYRTIRRPKSGRKISGANGTLPEENRKEVMSVMTLDGYK